MNLFDLFHKVKTNRKAYPYLIIFLACGVLLMIIPEPSEGNRSDIGIDTYSLEFSIEKEEKRLEEILSSIDGAGKCKVLLSIHTGAETILAEDEGETVVLSSGGQQSTITVQTRYPEFHGAIIVTGGSHDTSVRYDILSSVMAYTGLSTDRITICPINE